MTTLRQVGQALADRLEAIPGLRVMPSVPETPSTFPLAFVTPPPLEYENLTMTSMALLFGVVVLVSRAPDERRQLDLLDYQDVAGAKSVPAAIQANPSLGLTGVSAYVNASRPLGAEEIAGYQAYGLIFDVPVRLG